MRTHHESSRVRYSDWYQDVTMSSTWHLVSWGVHRYTHIEVDVCLESRTSLPRLLRVPQFVDDCCCHHGRLVISTTSPMMDAVYFWTTKHSRTSYQTSWLALLKKPSRPTRALPRPLAMPHVVRQKASGNYVFTLRVRRKKGFPEATYLATTWSIPHGTP